MIELTTRTTRSLNHKRFALVRTITSSPLPAGGESATLNDTNFDPTLALNCEGFDTIWLGAEIDGGTNVSIVVEPLVYDSGASDGSRWRRLLVGSPDGIDTVSALAVSTVTLANDGRMTEVRVDGRSKIFFRLVSTANGTGTTAARLLAMPGRTRLRIGD